MITVRAYTVRKAAGDSRRLRPAHHARVFARCGERFVYFNGTTALIIAADKRRVEARGTYGVNASGQYVGRAESARGSVTVGPYTLALEGVIYMH